MSITVTCYTVQLPAKKLLHGSSSISTGSSCMADIWQASSMCGALIRVGEPVHGHMFKSLL